MTKTQNQLSAYSQKHQASLVFDIKDEYSYASVFNGAEVVVSRKRFRTSTVDKEWDALVAAFERASDPLKFVQTLREYKIHKVVTCDNEPTTKTLLFASFFRPKAVAEYKQVVPKMYQLDNPLKSVQVAALRYCNYEILTYIEFT